MHLPLFFHGQPGTSPLRPALHAAIVATAAIAGYVTFLPLTQRSNPAALTTAEAEQPQWAGRIEQPDVDTPAPSARITSASYVVPEAGSIDNGSKKSGAAAAVMPKVAGKAILPPRRPNGADEALRTVAPVSGTPVAGTPIAATSIPPATGTPVPPAPIPVVMAAAEAPVKPARNLFSPVTDRLPTTGNLLKPFHVVGDAFHNLIKSF
jgi:hypothetical protein